MKPHEMKGQTREIQQGALKGRYFVVTDYIVNQFQGKDIEKIKKAHWGLFLPVKRRGFPVDDKVVIGKLYPTLEIVCVHDKELEDAIEADTLPVDLAKENVVSIKRGKKKEKLQ